MVINNNDINIENKHVWTMKVQQTARECYSNTRKQHKKWLTMQQLMVKISQCGITYAVIFPFCQKMKFDIQYLNLPLEAKVSLLIEGDQWNNLITELPNSELKRKIMMTPVNQLMEKDEIVWTFITSSRFFSKSVYDNLCKLRNKV